MHSLRSKHNAFGFKNVLSQQEIKKNIFDATNKEFLKIQPFSAATEETEGELCSEAETVTFGPWVSELIITVYNYEVLTVKRHLEEPQI